MNILLLDEAEAGCSNVVHLTGRQASHLREVLRIGPGDSVRVGMLNGPIGRGKILTMAQEEVTLQVCWQGMPAAGQECLLVLALPRPKVLRRVLQHVATMGVSRLVLVNAFRVEKSYWQSPFLQPDAIRELCVLGLEQAGSTRMPEVLLRSRFRPFVEDELPGMLKHTRAFVAHPYTQTPCPYGVPGPLSLAVGPEGGWIPFEFECLVAAGMQPVHLGQRILRVETAIPYLLGRLAMDNGVE